MQKKQECWMGNDSLCVWRKRSHRVKKFYLMEPSFGMHWGTVVLLYWISTSFFCRFPFFHPCREFFNFAQHNLTAVRRKNGFNSISIVAPLELLLTSHLVPLIRHVWASSGTTNAYGLGQKLLFILPHPFVDAPTQWGVKETSFLLP